jgi:hypothetical protein
VPRIMLDEVEAHRVVMVLHAHVVEELPEVLYRDCVELSRCGLSVVLVLSEIASIGRPGAEVLGRLARAGIGIIGCSPSIADALEQEGFEADRNSGGA